MKRSIVTPRRALVVITLLLLVAGFLPTRAARVVTNTPNKLLETILGPVSGVFVSITTTLRPAMPIAPVIPPDKDPNRLYMLERAYSAKLEQENALLKETLQRWNAISSENRSVRLLDANVILVSNEPINPVLTIDRGAASGVREKMAVVWWESLVGRVVAVGPRTADVRLITAEQSGIEVRIAPLDPERPPGPVGDIGGINERAMPYDDGAMFYVDLDRDVPVNVGDVAHLHDRILPEEAQGFIVGQVTQIIDMPENPLLLKRVLIQPTWRPLASLNRVTVLIPEEDHDEEPAP